MTQEYFCEHCQHAIREDQAKKIVWRDGKRSYQHGDLLDCREPASAYIDECAVERETEKARRRRSQ